MLLKFPFVHFINTLGYNVTVLSNINSVILDLCSIDIYLMNHYSYFKGVLVRFLNLLIDTSNSVALLDSNLILHGILKIKNCNKLNFKYIFVFKFCKKNVFKKLFFFLNLEFKKQHKNKTISKILEKSFIYLKSISNLKNIHKQHKILLKI